jgi:hypothetical protein
MRTPAILCVLCATLLVAPSLGGNGGVIGIYSDWPDWYDCNVIEAMGPPMSVYVVHWGSLTPSANTSQFMIQNNWTTAFPGAEQYGGNLFIGSTPGNTIYEGGTITYVGCKPLPHLLAELQFFFSGVFSPPCTVGLLPVADPIVASGQIEVVHCDGSTILFATGSVMRINGNLFDCPTCPNATEETSWSRVKALYR